MDANKVGDYKLVYSVTNSRGKTTTFTRTVHVQKQAVTPATDKNEWQDQRQGRQYRRKTRRQARRRARQQAPTSPESPWPIMVLAVAAGVLIVLRRKEAGDR